ncbi:MAG TPA: UDP-N-acetylglucosamine 2-epimerase (non-hydrolyzing) [Acidimicrobiales bacterium]|nr:UDP-N-acetylglucosamine 2-epimerase (non-hydrolyzing) [Acidimicrobiales bacterium]
MRPLVVVGARPNFMKAAPLLRAMAERPGFEPLLVHTGQHFDREMSGEFFEALELPAPDVHLGIGAGSRAWQLGEILHRLEPVYGETGSDATVVVGDVSSTLAAALTSSTLGIPVAHVEAGLRSRNWSMPEEANRVLTDRLSDWLFTPSEDADANLLAEGIEPERIFRVGNLMIDSLLWMSERVDAAQRCESFGVEPGRFALATLHRPGNVDDPAVLGGLVDALTEVSRKLPLLFPVHPRTRARLEALRRETAATGLGLLPPLAYPDFVALMSCAALILTDSGGIQEEAMVLGTPCLTLREETERPVTLAGSNEVVGILPGPIVEAAMRRLEVGRAEPVRPPLWDGHAAERVLDVLAAGPPARGR